MAPMQQPARPGAQPQPDQKLMQMFKVLELAAAKKIYDPQASKGLVETMKTAGDPPAAVAHTAIIVLDDLRQAVAAKGIPPTMVDVVAPAVVAMLFDLGNAAGLFKPSPEMVKTAVDLIKQNRQQPAQPEAEQSAGIIGSAMPAPAGVQ